jgi:hypothetical protein
MVKNQDPGKTSRIRNTAKKIWYFNFKQIQIQILERVLPTDAKEEHRLPPEEGKIKENGRF